MSSSGIYSQLARKQKADPSSKFNERRVHRLSATAIVQTSRTPAPEDYWTRHRLIPDMHEPWHVAWIPAYYACFIMRYI